MSIADLPEVALPDARPSEHPGQNRLTQAVWATRVQFAALGVLAGAWGVHIPSVKTQYGLDEATLSLVLLSAASGAVLSLFFVGRMIARMGARRATALAAVAMGAMLAMALQWPSLALLLPSMVMFGAAMSLYDVAINTEGSAIENLSGRAIMSGLHGMFSVGAMTGAALTAALIAAGIPPGRQLAGIGIGLAVIVAWASRSMLVTHPTDPTRGAQAHFAWPRGTLLVIGLLIFAGMSAEGAMYDWCVLYLKQEVHLSQDQAGLGYATFAGAMAIARFGGDPLRAHYSERTLLRVGGTVAAAAMAMVLLSGSPVVSFIGYALVGTGLAPVVPILYNAATRVPGTSRAAAIAAVSSIGYSGFMVGPPLIGGIAHGTSLTVALCVVVVASAFLAWGARYVPQQG